MIKVEHIEFKDDIFVTLTNIRRGKELSRGISEHYVVEFCVYKLGFKVYEGIHNPISLISNFIYGKSREGFNEMTGDYVFFSDDDGIKFYTHQPIDKGYKLRAELTPRQKEIFIYWLGDFCGVSKKFINRRLQKNVILLEKIIIKK